jgi:23S rRNA (guanosine2251-2'-O)-methyltransferase
VVDKIKIGCSNWFSVKEAKMAEYAFFECTHPSCRLRFPLDMQRHKGAFCPRCGGKLKMTHSDVDIPFTEPSHTNPARRFMGVLDNIRSAHNVGGIFRTADGAGVERLYLCGITPTPAGHPELAKTALGAENAVAWSAHENSLIVARALRAEGVFLLALERTAESTPIQEFSLERLEERPIALLIGHERAGVDPGLLEICDGIVDLPMAGSKASLNVTVAFGVAGYWLALQKNF